ncbi:SprT-like domain-containing protein [Falsiroseomonas oryziterrae]|uniref:SprT-like domain-containing protein n=1 Tax=Falsiroseomonas oryziterrae TaxID=2911368 RepID=UPI001F2A97B0|nr:SprT-like domain-containing protein [Roseomonas sp. NPKOSM-4]
MSRGDRQAARLYAWEDAVVAPRDRSRVPFARLQALVDHVWAEEGRRWPPRIRPLPKQARRTVARATRTAIECPPELPSWVLLHEVAHALTADVDGVHAGHGPDFVAAYLRLLERHARLDRALLEATLAEAGIAWTTR